MDLDRRALMLRGASALMAMSAGGLAEAAAPDASDLNAPWADVRHFGAKGDGTTIDSPAFNRAIDFVAARGGGVVHVPAGIHACYTIRLKSKVTLNLDPGAVILAAPTPLEGTRAGGYDAPEPQGDWAPYQDYGHNHWANSLIWGDGLHDIAIVGGGLIWGKGLSRGHDTDADLPQSGKPGVGDKAIALKNCHNVLLRDFRVLQGGWFALLATGVDNLTIDNLLIDTNRDGMDIDCCRNVRVTRCTVNSPWDDGICPKSSFALGYARSTENVTISDCFLSGNYQMGSVLDGTWTPMPASFAPYAIGRIKCGTESNGGFKNIAISNCVFDHARGICLETVDGAQMEDITITGVTMRGAMRSPLFLRLGQRMRGPAGVPVGVLKRVLISNLTSSGATQLPAIIAGVEGHPVEDIKISNVFLGQVGGGSAQLAARQPPANEDGYPETTMFGDLPATGLFARHVRGLEVSHLEVQTERPDARPAFWLQDVDGADFFDVTTPGAAAFDLDRVSRFRCFGSRTVADTRFEAAGSRKL